MGALLALFLARLPAQPLGPAVGCVPVGAVGLVVAEGCLGEGAAVDGPDCWTKLLGEEEGEEEGEEAEEEAEEEDDDDAALAAFGMPGKTATF